MTLTERYDRNYEQKLINEYNAAMIGLYQSEDEKTKRILVYIEYLIEHDRLKNLIDNDCIKEFNDINKAIKFAKALSEKYPDATIDVNDSSDENSVWGVN